MQIAKNQTEAKDNNKSHANSITKIKKSNEKIKINKAKVDNFLVNRS